MISITKVTELAIPFFSGILGIGGVIIYLTATDGSIIFVPSSSEDMVTLINITASSDTKINLIASQ